MPLNKWLLAAYLVASSKKGFAAHQLHRSIDVQYKMRGLLAVKPKAEKKDKARKRNKHTTEK